MIPTIGVMIGFYILTRMISLASRQGDRAESMLTKIFAAITILVAISGIMGLVGTQV